MNYLRDLELFYLSQDMSPLTIAHYIAAIVEFLPSLNQGSDSFNSLEFLNAYQSQVLLQLISFLLPPRPHR